MVASYRPPLAATIIGKVATSIRMRFGMVFSLRLRRFPKKPGTVSIRRGRVNRDCLVAGVSHDLPPLLKISDSVRLTAQRKCPLPALRADVASLSVRPRFDELQDLSLRRAERRRVEPGGLEARGADGLHRRLPHRVHPRCPARQSPARRLDTRRRMRRGAVADLSAPGGVSRSGAGV